MATGSVLLPVSLLATGKVAVAKGGEGGEGGNGGNNGGGKGEGEGGESGDDGGSVFVIPHEIDCHFRCGVESRGCPNDLPFPARRWREPLEDLFRVTHCGGESDSL